MRANVPDDIRSIVEAEAAVGGATQTIVTH
jgi:hypothetical protein